MWYAIVFSSDQILRLNCRDTLQDVMSMSCFLTRYVNDMWSRRVRNGSGYCSQIKVSTTRWIIINVSLDAMLHYLWYVGWNWIWMGRMTPSQVVTLLQRQQGQGAMKLLDDWGDCPLQWPPLSTSVVCRSPLKWIIRTWSRFMCHEHCLFLSKLLMA